MSDIAHMVTELISDLGAAALRRIIEIDVERIQSAAGDAYAVGTWLALVVGAEAELTRREARRKADTPETLREKIVEWLLIHHSSRLLRGPLTPALATSELEEIILLSEKADELGCKMGDKWLTFVGLVKTERGTRP